MFIRYLYSFLREDNALHGIVIAIDQGVTRFLKSRFPFLLPLIVLLTGCSTNLPTDAGAMLVTLSNSFPGIWHLITGASYLLGILFASRAVFAFKVYGELRTMMASQTNLKAPITFFLVAGVFFYLPTAFQIIMVSTFGYSGIQNPLSYTGPTVAGLDQTSMVAVLQLIQIVGLIAFIRGWLILAHAAQGQQGNTVGKGITHIIGGVLAMNIVGTAAVINASLGIGS
jgi:intracellular multiplication protein IcmC